MTKATLERRSSASSLLCRPARRPCEGLELVGPALATFLACGAGFAACFEFCLAFCLVVCLLLLADLALLLGLRELSLSLA